MGSSLSTNWATEQERWALPHKLNYDVRLRQEQIPLIDRFGPKLLLCFNKISKYGIEYEHWWVSDRKWVIEFGGGEVSNCNVIVHCNPKANFLIDREFDKTPEVEERMLKVCGATNYSLALRNCEHVARFISYGSWQCFQMIGDGILKKTFFDYMSSHTKVINTFPEELRPEEMIREPLYPPADVRLSIEWKGMKEALTTADNDAWNIVVLGPTGSGKSTIINNLFNETVCQTGDSAESVTRQVLFHNGSNKFTWNVYDQDVVGGRRSYRHKRVNVIDTIGEVHSTPYLKSF